MDDRAKEDRANEIKKRYVPRGELYSRSDEGYKAREVSQKIRNEALEEEVLQPIRAKTKVTKLQGKLHSQYRNKAANFDERMNRDREIVDYWVDRNEPESGKKGYGLERKKKKK